MLPSKARLHCRREIKDACLWMFSWPKWSASGFHRHQNQAPCRVSQRKQQVQHASLTSAWYPCFPKPGYLHNEPGATAGLNYRSVPSTVQVSQSLHKAVSNLVLVEVRLNKQMGISAANIYAWGNTRSNSEEAVSGALGGTAHGRGKSRCRWDIWLQLDECIYFPLTPAHNVTSTSAFKTQPPQQGKAAQVKKNPLKSHQLLFPTKSETSLVVKWLSGPNPRMSGRGSEQLESWGLMSRLGKTTIKCLFSCRNGCLPNLQCNTEHLFLVLQNSKISQLLCTAADKCTQNDRATSHIYSLCFYPQCL